MTLSYRSTRGLAAELDFRGVTMAGLASDGGLFVPSRWPQFSVAEIRAFRDLPYTAIAKRVMAPFVEGVLDEETLGALVDKTYAAFAHPDVTPLHFWDKDHALLELFHGPTLAFKDVALQFLGHVFAHFLEESGQSMTVLGATSGDTGSAAIAALAGRPHIQTMILYPEGRPSDIQRKQMTCVDAPNVHALALQGSFDDCQAIVKTLFSDAELNHKFSLAAVNSINWCRILAQIVYYFYAASRMGAPEIPVSFVVPTGNFGDIFAGYAAHRCGLPVGKLVVASNANDILPRFFETGEMKVGQVAPTLSPSMDIQISSNFERLLFDLCGQNSVLLREKMNDLKTKGCFSFPKDQWVSSQDLFLAERASDEQTLETIAKTYQSTGYALDPHTAVGIFVAQKLMKEIPTPIVTLATASAAKFPDVVQRVTGYSPPLPPAVSDLLRKPERQAILLATKEAVQDFLFSRLGAV